MNRRRILALALFVVLAATFAAWRFATHDAPAGQSPLATLDATSVAALRNDFNAAAGQTRIILLLSPT